MIRRRRVEVRSGSAGASCRVLNGSLFFGYFSVERFTRVLQRDVLVWEGGDMVHRPTRGVGEGHYLFIYYGLSPYSGNPVTRVVHAVLARQLGTAGRLPLVLRPIPPCTTQ